MHHSTSALYKLEAFNIFYAFHRPQGRDQSRWRYQEEIKSGKQPLTLRQDPCSTNLFTMRIELGGVTNPKAKLKPLWATCNKASCSRAWVPRSPKPTICSISEILSHCTITRGRSTQRKLDLVIDTCTRTGNRRSLHGGTVLVQLMISLGT